VIKDQEITRIFAGKQEGADIYKLCLMAKEDYCKY
jgi:hypothetical protein